MACFSVAVASFRLITLVKALPQPLWFLQNKFQKALAFMNLKDLLTFGFNTRVYPLNTIHHQREMRSSS